MKGKDIEAFKLGVKSNVEFWLRFGEKPKFFDKNVLDIGSGWGTLAVNIAEEGAKNVLGLDIKCELVDFANDYVREYYPTLQEKIFFKCIELDKYNPENLLDIIVSKDSFEHIMDLDGMLDEMYRCLKPGGKIYAGFGPLYESPFGDHDRRISILKDSGFGGQLIMRLPWGHLIFSKLLIDTYNKNNKKNISSFRELQLNMLKFSTYLKIFNKSNFRIEKILFNRTNKIKSKVLLLLSKIPILRNYCIHNIYVILEKPGLLPGEKLF